MSGITRFDWLRRQSRPRRSQNTTCYNRPLRIEPLEDRRLLAITVDTLVDEADGSIVDGDVSLRDAIAAASAGETIDFSITGVLTLTLGELTVDKSLTVAGPGQTMLTINGGGASRIFNVDDGNAGNLLNVDISGLKLFNGNAAGPGGAVRSTENLTLVDSIVTNSTATGSGGGIYVRSGSGGVTTITGTTIQNNTATGAAADGGGLFIYADNAIVNISTSTISGNSASGSSGDGGGTAIAAYNGSQVQFDRTTVSGNSIAGNFASGGGAFVITNGGGKATFTNSTISGNQSNHLGGGVSVAFSSSVLLLYSTITDNTSDADSNGSGHGGGLFHDIFSTVTLDHAIVAGNTDNTSTAPDLAGDVTVEFSLVGDNSGATITDLGGNQIGTAGSPIDPLLGLLVDNAGPTLTHRLLNGSPAIDAGDTPIFAPVIPDQRGFPFVRVSNGRSDIGAYEVQTLSLTVDNTSDENDGDFGIGNMSLREALDLANVNPGAETVSFSPSLADATIALGGTELVILDDLTLTGLGADQLTIDAQSNSRVMRVAPGVSAQISGLTLTGGSAVFGGGLSNEVGATTSLDDLVIRNNEAASFGFAGGGIHNAGDLTITDSEIRDNDETVFGSGGGIAHTAGNLTINRTRISGNTAQQRGGGIYAMAGTTIEVSESVITGNSQQRVEGDGGGIALVDVDGASIVGSEISFNHSANRGGGIFIMDATADDTIISNSTIANNTADGDGGGIAVVNSINVTIQHSTVAGNTSDDDNDASGAGGGISISGAFFDAFDHTIVANNVDKSDVAPDISGALPARYSLIGDNTGATITNNGGNQIGTGVGPIDPQLNLLTLNGGLTRTLSPSPSSPALDTGNPALIAGVAPTPLTDQRGLPFSRVAGVAIDIGAYERQALTGLNLTVDTAIDENDGDHSTGDLSLREAIILANASAGADTVLFDASLDGATIPLELFQMVINEELVIDASALPTGLTVDGQNNSRLFVITPDTGDYTIRGLTLTGGHSTGSGAAVLSLSTDLLSLEQSTVTGNNTIGNFVGGGIASRGDVALVDTLVSDNTTVGIGARGAGVFASQTLSLMRSTISGNSTSGDFADGGGIHANSVIGTESVISNNSSGASGGGIYSFGVDLIDSVVTGNGSVGHGGGVHAYFGNVTLTRSTVSDNSVTGDYSDGGGIAATKGSVTLISSTVNGNQTNGLYSPYFDYYGNGAGIRARDGVTITDSTVSNNVGGFWGAGGGIFSGGNVTITGSTISGNSASRIGGVSAGGDVTVRHSTITQNSPGGVENDNNTVTIRNSIVAGNGTGSIGDLSPGTGPLIVEYSLIGDARGLVIGGTSNIIGDSLGSGVVDPLLGPLEDNGGLTETHSLLTGSPAIDAGDPLSEAGIGVTPLFDQRGDPFDRVLEGNGLGVARIDIGAFEVPTSTTPTADFDSDGDVDGFDFLSWQRGFGTPAPTATHADGDADFDLDVDTNDLNIWEAQFGQAEPAVAPVVAAAESIAPIAAVILEPVEVTEPLAAVEVVTIAEPVFRSVHSESTSDGVEPSRVPLLDDELVDAIFRRSGKRLRHSLHDTREEFSQAKHFVEQVFGEVGELYHSFDIEHDPHDQEHWHNRLSKRAEEVDDWFDSLGEEGVGSKIRSWL